MFIGKFVIVRGTDSGVYCGVLVEVHARAVVLKDSRNIWSWERANTLHELSLHGCSESSRISEPVQEEAILDVVQIIPCTAEARANLERSRWS